MTSNVEPFLIGRYSSLKSALKQLEETEERILFVTNDDGTLLGALADGDVRRWILSEGSLADPVEKVCNRDPCYVQWPYDMDGIRQTMLARNINCIPVLDPQRRITELVFWESAFGGRQQERALGQVDVPVVIMAGGKGTRLDPFTRILPKPLIPVGDRAVIEIIIERFVKHGVSEFYLSVNHKAKIIKSFFEELDPAYRVSFIEEDMPSGTAGSLKMLDGSIHGAFFVTNCDVIISADYAEILQHHQTNGNDVTLVGSMKTFHIPYGVCEIQSGGELAQINEKPEYNLLVNTGMYVLESSVLDLIPSGQMFHTTDLIAAVKQAGGTVGVYPISEGAWLDTGEWEEYRRAVQHLGVLASVEGIE